MSDKSIRQWLSPGFLTAVVVLGVAAVGLNGAVNRLKLHFVKAPVPLALPLTTLAPTLGDWVQVSKDEPLEKELQDSLATDKFIFRDFADRKLVSKLELDEFDGKTAAERKQLLSALQTRRPSAVINLAVTYYTGGMDTVAHIPDRCYIADGYAPSEYETRNWDAGPNRLGKANGEDPRIQVRFINFEDQTGVGRVTRRVAYFFHANGHYESDPLAVRKHLQNLMERYGYYAKVELMMQGNIDHDQAERVMAQFLASALPEVEKCLPDWNKVETAGVKK